MNNYSILFNLIYKPVFMSNPFAREMVFKRLRLAKSFKGMVAISFTCLFILLITATLPGLLKKGMVFHCLIRLLAQLIKFV